MEEDQTQKIEALKSKIAVLKADRDDLYMKLSLAKQTIQSLHDDLGQIMEFIVEKRKDLSFIGPEFSAVFNGDDEILVHEMEFNYPNLHTLVNRDFETASKRTPSISRLKLRGVALFRDVNASNVEAMYPNIPEEALTNYLSVIWNQMTFYEKKNWLEKRVIYPRNEEQQQTKEE
ncbi:hypothetical protein WA171_002705 [Blastocystis sp. BT1]